MAAIDKAGCPLGVLVSRGDKLSLDEINDRAAEIGYCSVVDIAFDPEKPEKKELSIILTDTVGNRILMPYSTS